MADVLVLGGGFGGLAAAHELRRRLPSDDTVTVIAARDTFFVGFAKLWELSGLRPLADGTRSLSALDQHGIRFVHADITAIDAGARSVGTSAGAFTADAMVIALGAGYQQKHTALLGEHAHNLYDATALPGIRADLDALTSGTLLVSILGAPYLCPPAPFEAALLLDEWLRANGRRDQVDVVVSTPQPLTLPVAGPDASHFLAERLTERGVTVLTEHPVESVDHAAGLARFSDDRSREFQLMLGVPAAAPLPVVAASDVASESGWIKPDRSMFATSADRVYAVGDCTMVPTATAQLPKAGVFAEAEGLVAAANVAADLHGGERESFDGYGYCFLELPGQRVAKVEGDFYAEPKPDVALTPPDEAAFTAKQQWERERLAAWLG
ncbi:FAD-dependent oxidoreductase, partial [Haloechinothrix halophila]|uniref:FAD-dependent oxidoreductase n=1 Tax=Haloechinothrix halophila TaxID=1069073 RepID=UPI000401E0CD